MKPSSSADTQCSVRAPRAISLLAALVFVGALTGASSGKEPVYTWFYPLAWGSLLLFIDAIVYRRRKESLILSHPKRFVFFAGLSAVLWFMFEAINLRLGNWTYQGLPACTAARWLGYALSFATIIPAIMEVSDFLETCGWPISGVVTPLRARPSFWVLLATGVAMLAAALIWPTVCFPFVWGAFILIVDPINDRIGAPSLLRDWREGSMRRVAVLSLAGLICGILWQVLNGVAGARWTYHIPGLSKFTVFGMPLLGYAGFPIFAVELFVLSACAVTVWGKLSKITKVALILGAVGLIWNLCGMMDRLTAGIGQ